MSLLFKLPTDLYNEVCSEWLETIDMGKLDSAMCSSVYRDTLMTQLSDKSMRHEIGKELDSYYNWIGCRNISLQVLVCSRFLFDEEGHCKFNLKLDCVKQVYFSKIDRICLQSVRRILSACTSLVYLEWRDDNELGLSGCGSLGIKLSNLKHLNLTICADSFDTYEWIVEHCVKLQRLSVTSFELDDEASYEVLLEVLRKNSNTLEHIDLQFSFDLINDVTKLCPKVKTIKMDMGDISLQQILYYMNTFGDRVEFTFDSVNYCATEPKSLTVNIKDEAEAEIVNFVSQFEGLTTLEFGKTFEGFQGDNVVNDMFMRSYATLTELKISGDLFSSNAINQILSQCKRLQILKTDSREIFADVFQYAFNSTSLTLTEIHVDNLFIPYRLLVVLFKHLLSLKLLTTQADLDSTEFVTKFEEYQVVDKDPKKELIMTIKFITPRSFLNLHSTFFKLEFTRK